MEQWANRWKASGNNCRPSFYLAPNDNVCNKSCELPVSNDGQIPAGMTDDYLLDHDSRESSLTFVRNNLALLIDPCPPYVSIMTTTILTTPDTVDLCFKPLANS